MLEQVGVGTKKAKTFQTSLQKSPRLKKLFNGDLEEQIASLKRLAQGTETAWWDMARAEFLNGGEIQTGGTLATTPSLNAAEEACAGAMVLMNQILVELAKITIPSVPVVLNWSGTGTAVPLDYDSKSFYGPYVADVCDKLTARVTELKAQLSTAQNYAEFNSRADALKNTYTWAATEFQKFGPHFPTVFTDYFSNYTKGKADYNKPEFAAGIDDGLHTLMLVSYPVGGESTLTEVAFAGASTGFHKLNSGDTVTLAKLELEDFEGMVGSQYEVRDLAANLEGFYTPALELAIGNTAFAEIATNNTGQALNPGENFILRKIVDAPFYLDKASQTIADDDVSETVVLTARAADAWTAASDEVWAVPTASGTGSGNVVVTCTANTGEVDRVAVITVTRTSDGIARTFTLTQSAPVGT